MEGAGPENRQDADHVSYFSSYESLYQQKSMLEDHVCPTKQACGASASAVPGADAGLLPRHNAQQGVLRGPHGAGCGCWHWDPIHLGSQGWRQEGSPHAAPRTAERFCRKVYAVEATVTAQHARDLVAANGVSDVVEVIQAKMEEVELPEKVDAPTRHNPPHLCLEVDIIISEWMGYFLVYESMLDTVITARDKWLVDGGALYPSHAQIYVAPLKCGCSQHELQLIGYPVTAPDRGTEKNAGLVDCMDEWGTFLDESQVVQLGI